jgi:ABC-2 type transport system permease protein
MRHASVLTRIWHMVIKEFIQFGRDRLLTLFLFTFPVMQLVLVAQATATGVTSLPTAVLDQDSSRASRGLAQALDRTEELSVDYFPKNVAEVARLLDGGQAGLAIIIPPNFERDMLDGTTPVLTGQVLPNHSGSQSAQLQVIADASNSITANVALRTAEGAITSTLTRLLGAAGQLGPVDLRVTTRFNRSLDSRYYAIPAQLAFIVYQVTLAVAALGLARERELGTLEQLSVTPLRRFELLTGKAMPAAIIGLIDFGAMFVIVVEVYSVPMEGSWGLLFLLSALFIIAEVCWGLTISAISRTQQQAVLFIFMLAIAEVMLSGYLVPVARLPLVLKAISLFSPMRHYLVILRSIMLKGANLTTLWPQAVGLLALGSAMAYLSRRNVARAFE